VLADQADRGGRVGGDETPQGEDADQMLVIVHRVQGVGRLRGRSLADLVDGLAHGKALVNGQHLGRHDAARRLLPVLEQLLDLLGLLLLHQVENFLGLLLGQLVDHLGGVVGLQPIEDARDLHLVHGAHEVQELLVVQLAEDIAGLLRVEQPENEDLLGHWHVPQGGGDVGGMRFLEELDEALVPPRLHQLADGLAQPGCVFHRRAQAVGRAATGSRGRRAAWAGWAPPLSPRGGAGPGAGGCGGGASGAA
jgi:hypothetical protein